MRNPVKQIESIMYGEKNSPLAPFLSVLSTAYCGIIRIRGNLYEKGILKSEKLPCVVISVGNITVGGTGKTPMTIYIAELIKGFGLNVAVVSRGYKGRAEKTGGIVSDGQNLYMNAAAAGDEPCMIAERLKGIPVIIGQNRFRSGSSAVKRFNPDVIILDDAFQHLQLQRDINLVLLDNNLPFGNACLLPRGTLREPLSALRRCDAFVLTRADCGQNSLPGELKKFVPKRPVFRSSHVPYLNRVVTSKHSGSGHKPQIEDSLDINILRGKKLFLFSGIADNRAFYNSIHAIEQNIKGFLRFHDHYIYNQDDINKITQSALKSKADYIVTTEKDYARLDRKTTWPLDLAVAGVEISFGKDEEAFNIFIKRKLTLSGIENL